MAYSESYTDESDQPSVYELLSASERIVDVNMSLKMLISRVRSVLIGERFL